MNLLNSTNQAVTYDGLIDEIAYIDGNLTSAVRILLASVVAIFMTFLLLFDGDSLTAGYYAAEGSSYPEQCFALIGGQGTYINVAVNGQNAADMLSDAMATIDPLATHTKNILVAWGGANDIFWSHSGTTTYNQLVSYCTGRRAAGYLVIIVDILPSTAYDATKETERTILNTALAANWASFANGFVQASVDPRLIDPTNETYYYTDHRHLIDAGQTVMAELVAVQVQPLL
jgi:lysophospholipase L1-like esterase